MNNKKTLVVGASENPERYSNKAIQKLKTANHTVVAYGRKTGKVDEVEITTDWPEEDDIHSISLYLRDTFQKDLYEHILALNPKRIIFNPGTENPELEKLARQNGIETLNACTLVMLSIGNY